MKKIIIILIAAMIAFSGCSSEEKPQKTPVTDIPEEETAEELPEEDPSEEELIEDSELEKYVFDGRKEQLASLNRINPDVKSWIFIPGIPDIDKGVCYSDDRAYPYSKKNILGEEVQDTYWIDGAYFNHYRNSIGKTKEELSINTVVFGNSDMGVTNLAYEDDDPNGPLFSGLFNFRDPSFAEKTPFIYLTLEEEETVWEIFSVFYNDAAAINSTFSAYYKKNGGSLWYLEPDPTADEYQLMLDTILERSIFDYNVEVTADDKILTLTTATVGYGISKRDNYRFVIVAKLADISSGETVGMRTDVTVKADAPVPDTFRERLLEYAKTNE